MFSLARTMVCFGLVYGCGYFAAFGDHRVIGVIVVVMMLCGIYFGRMTAAAEDSADAWRIR